MNDQIPAQCNDYSLEQIDGEILLYSPSQTRTIYLNQTASMIWQLCDGQRNVDQIVSILDEAFPDTDNLSRDITLCLDQLVTDGALSIQ